MTSKSRGKLQTLLAFVGVLALLATVALAAGTMRPTEATWQDTVAGEAEFAMANPDKGNNFAHATAGYGSIARSVTSGKLNPFVAHATGSNSRSFRDQPFSTGGVFGLVKASGDAYSCARSEPANLLGACLPAPLTENPTAYSTSTLRDFQVSVGAFEGIPRLRFGTYDYNRGVSAPAIARAECRPGERGSTSLTSSVPLVSAGPLLVGGTSDYVALDIPAPNSEITVRHSVGVYDYTATLQHIQQQGIGHAKTQLRLKVVAKGNITNWDLHMILAHAECGASRAAVAPPTEPKIGEWPTLASQGINSSRSVRMAAPAALQPITDMAEDELAQDGVADDAEANEDETGKDAGSDPVHDEDELPSLPNVNELADEAADAETTTPATSMTYAPATSAPADQTTNTTEPSAPETSTTVPSTSTPAAPTRAPTVPAVPESAEPTTPTETVSTPQQPQDVRVGRSFTVTGADGAELGTAKVEDIVRTPGCGVELTLSITTSAEAGPGRWASIGPDDFAEVRPGGTTRDAQRINSDCEQTANSRTTDLSPGSSYEIVIAFQLSDSAQKAMLRPEGTAGWIFDLPALTLPTPPQPPVTTTATSTPETTAQTAEA